MCVGPHISTLRKKNDLNVFLIVFFSSQKQAKIKNTKNKTKNSHIENGFLKNKHS